MNLIQCKRKIHAACRMQRWLPPALLFCTTLVAPSHAQTFSILHSFTGGLDGGGPTAGLTLDRGANLYGTTDYGGNTSGACYPDGCGVIFKLSQRNSAWIVTPLYAFHAFDGQVPQAPVIFGPSGRLYGTTVEGGGTGCGGGGCGTVFSSYPPAHAPASILGDWGEGVLYSFQGGNDGSSPQTGSIVFDQAGNIYGTTVAGGPSNWGIVYQLTYSSGSWTRNILYSFNGGSDGGYLYSGVVIDGNGNLFGVTTQGGVYGFGTIYELTPSEPGWAKTTLYNFQGATDGEAPIGGLVFDEAGNLYGTTSEGGAGGGGTVYELTPSNGGWTLTTIYSFTGSLPNSGPWDSLTIDAAGNLYGTALFDGFWGQGSVFELAPEPNGWTFTDLHDFRGTLSDGAHPYGFVTLDTAGNLYGTTSNGGANNYGIVWQIAR